MSLLHYTRKKRRYSTASTMQSSGFAPCNSGLLLRLHRRIYLLEYNRLHASTNDESNNISDIKLDVSAQSISRTPYTIKRRTFAPRHLLPRPPNRNPKGPFTRALRDSSAMYFNGGDYTSRSAATRSAATRSAAAYV